MRKHPQGAVLGTDFTEGKIFPLMLKFMLPFVLANLLNSLYNTVDTIIIGQFAGSVGIVSVNMGGKMLNLFTQIGVTLAGGGQVLISQLYGAKHREEFNTTIGTLFTEMFSISLVLGVSTALLAEPLLHLLNTPQESMDGALAYLRITSLGLPLIFGYNAVSSVLRGMGDSRSPLIFIAIAAVINLIGDIVFIVYFHLGAMGTAIATVLGQGLSLLFSVTVLYRRRERFGFDFKLRSFSVDWHKLGIMLKIGFPMALRVICINFTQMYIISFVNLYGLAESAAYSIGDKLIHLTSIVTGSARQAGGSMVGQNIGAGRPDRVKGIVKSCVCITLSAASVLAACSLLFPTAIFSLFTDDPAVLAYARSFMAIAALIYILGAILSPYESVITGTGNSLLGFLGGILDGVVFRLGFSYLLVFVLGWGIAGFFLSDALARFGPLLVGSIYYHSGAWRRRKRLSEV